MLSVLVVTEVLSIASEKVTVMLSLIETALRLSVGEIFETVGAVLSITIALFAASDPEAPGGWQGKICVYGNSVTDRRVVIR